MVAKWSRTSWTPSDGFGLSGQEPVDFPDELAGFWTGSDQPA